MSISAGTPALCLGFLTVIEHAELGLLGGYLLLNPAGRPLEFHCTAPVKPTRTQEILYGRSLMPFLCGEHIGQTLIRRSKLTPLVVCTDREEVLAAREGVDLPMALVLTEDTAADGQFALARCKVTASQPDQAAVQTSWPAQADGLDLLEPFARIREALDEAQKTARMAA